MIWDKILHKVQNYGLFNGTTNYLSNTASYGNAKKMIH